MSASDSKLSEWARYRKRYFAAPLRPETKEIPCIKCRNPLKSEGPHHRMCKKCRHLDVGPDEITPSHER